MSIERVEVTGHYKTKYIEKAKSLYPNNNYDHVKYYSSSYNVNIYCNKHETFFSVKASEHISEKFMKNCPLCMNNENEYNYTSKIKNGKPKIDFINKAKSLYKFNDYSNISFYGTSFHVKILCTKHDTSFWVNTKNI